MVLIQISE